MCVVDLETCDVWVETPVKAARKLHHCDACGGRIERGSPYLRHFSRYDGYNTSEKVCEPCQEAIAEFLDAHGQVSVPGGFLSLLGECVADVPRKHREPQDMRWRSLLAGMIVRGRRAERMVTRTKDGESK